MDPSLSAVTVFLTPRLRCRLLGEGDVEALFGVYGDEDAMRWVGDGVAITLAQCEEWVGVTRRNYELRGYGMFAVEELGSGAVVGFCGIVHPGGQAEPEVKYALRREAWGRGYATEIVSHLLSYGARAHGLREIIATVHPDNLASQAVLLKAGAARGELRPNQDGSFTQVFVWRSGEPEGTLPG